MAEWNCDNCATWCTFLLDQRVSNHKTCARNKCEDATTLDSLLNSITMETEFQILNTLLADKAAQLQLTEYRIFDIFCAWENIDATKSEYEVIYPSRFELHDKQADLNFIKAAQNVAGLINSATPQKELKKQFVRITSSNDDLIGSSRTKNR